MRLICFECRGTRSVGIVEDTIVADLGHLLAEIAGVEGQMDDLLPLIEADVRQRLASFNMKTVLEAGRFVKDISEVSLCAPIKRPPKIICIGGNYPEHVKESKTGGKKGFTSAPPSKKSGKAPILFAKAANSVIGPAEKIVIPEESNEVDYEVELGVVIGKPGYRLSAEQAKQHIFGYTVLNDVTARDLQRTESQWYRAKGLATFCPIGPAMVSADEIDPDNLDLELTVNGETRQKSNTKEMAIGVYDLVSLISNITPLEPGDLIGTGTPEGVGAFMDPPVYLKSGDVVAATVQDIGTLENEVA